MKTCLIFFSLLPFAFLHGKVPSIDFGLEPPDPAVSKSEKAKLTELEIQKFQGIWKPVKAEYEGEKLNPKDSNWTLIISDNTVLQLRRGRVHVQGTMEVTNPHTGLERATWRFFDVGVINRVIYSFEKKDLLVTCWNGMRGGTVVYPTIFSSTGEGSGQYLVMWKRTK